MAKKALPSPEVLRQLLRYEPDTGKLFWLDRTPSMFEDGLQGAQHNCSAWNGRYAGKEAMTCIKSDGYRHGALFYSYVPAHRAIWALHSGEWPSMAVDHIDGNKINNRIENLRLADNAQNGWNRGAPKASKSGIKGVTLSQGKWRAQLTVRGMPIYLGQFKCRTAAAYAYAVASKEHHGQFGRVSLS